MSSRFRFVVDISTDRTEGKFAAREEISEQLQSMLENANDGSVYGIGADGMSTYEITDWDVSEEETPKRVKKGRRPPAQENTLEGWDNVIRANAAGRSAPVSTASVRTQMTHALCDHPKTAAARAACRANREKA